MAVGAMGTAASEATPRVASCGQAVRSGGKPPRTRLGHVRATCGLGGAPSALGACTMVAEIFCDI